MQHQRRGNEIAFCMSLPEHQFLYQAVSLAAISARKRNIPEADALMRLLHDIAAGIFDPKGSVEIAEAIAEDEELTASL